MSPLTSFGRHDRFCCLCNPGLLKTLRFSLQRHKAPEFGKAEFWDSMPVYCLAAFATLVCQKNSVFLCKGTKPTNSAQAEFVGFGLGRLVRQVYLGAKAGHPARGAHTVFTFSFKVI